MPQQQRPIEELLQRSTRAAQSLDAEKKDALWARIQQQAARESVLEEETAPSIFDANNATTRWWAAPLSARWSMGIGFAAVAIAIAGVYATIDQTEQAQQLAARAAQDAATYNQRNDLVEETPTPAEEDSEVAELPEEIQEQEENPIQIADTQTEHVTLFRNELSDLIGGFGGAIVWNSDLWKVTAATALSDTPVGAVDELYVYRLSEQRMRELASVFPITESLRYHTNHQPDFRIPFITNLQEGIAEGGGCFGNALRGTMGTQRCVTVSQLGAVAYVQEESVAETDGLAEAYSYINALTGENARFYTKVYMGPAINFAEQADMLEGSEEYMLYPVAELDGHAYQTVGWHVILKNGKLVFLAGAAPSIQKDASATTYSVISAAEAVERLQIDWAQPVNWETDKGPYYVIKHTFGGNQSGIPFKYSETGDYTSSIEDEDVDILIQEARLEYRLFIKGNWESKAKKELAARARPVWALYGVERSSDTPFEALIDATADNSMAPNEPEAFGLMIHPLSLE